MLIRKIGPAIWLSCIAFAWGALSLGIGFINTWEALAIMRAFLGVLEAVRLSRRIRGSPVVLTFSNRATIPAAYTSSRLGINATSYRRGYPLSSPLPRLSQASPTFSLSAWSRSRVSARIQAGAGSSLSRALSQWWLPSRRTSSLSTFQDRSRISS